MREVKIIVSAARHFPQGKEEVCNDLTGNRFKFRLSNDDVLLFFAVWGLIWPGFVLCHGGMSGPNVYRISI